MSPLFNNKNLLGAVFVVKVKAGVIIQIRRLRLTLTETLIILDIKKKTNLIIVFPYD